jgi:glucose/arabinose dehydrogenase
VRIFGAPGAATTRTVAGAISDVVASVVAGALVVGLAGCSAPSERTVPPSTPPGSPTSAPSTSPAPSPAPTPSPSASAAPVVMLPTGEVETIAEGLASPWSILRLPDGGVLVSERDTGNVVEVLADGSLRIAATLADVVPGAEGGLLGLAHLDAADGAYVYAAFTAASENRIVRMPLGGAPGSLELGAPETVLSGIPRGASNHQGGRIAFGPDGFLYATVGDAGERDAAQDPNSLAGKILRMTPEGSPAPGNPFGTLVYSLGHRNPQGLAWDASGRLWAAEFGQDTWDELNLIAPGANHGWPVVEGQAGAAGYADPVLQWPTSEASPSGLAIVGDTLFLAALRGERLWIVQPASAEAPSAESVFVGEYGRLRDAVPGPDGELWVITNNTDGRGSPIAGDDRLLRVRLAEG